MWKRVGMKQICENCGRTIAEEELAFRLRIEMFADPSLPDLSEEYMKCNFDEELQKLYSEIESMDPDEAQDEVFESYLFTVCTLCRQGLHCRLKERQMPFEEHF